MCSVSSLFEGDVVGLDMVHVRSGGGNMSASLMVVGSDCEAKDAAIFFEDVSDAVFKAIFPV